MTSRPPPPTSTCSRSLGGWRWASGSRARPATWRWSTPSRRGEPALRDALADHLGRTRGVIVDPAQIVVTQGTAQGVDVLLRLLRSRGADRIAVEDPSLRRQQQRVQAAGLALVAQPLDDEGLIVDGLAADAVLVTRLTSSQRVG